MTDMLPVIVARVVAVAGVALLTAVLPLFGSYVLDGLVRALRGNGLKLLLLSASMSLTLATVGFVAWSWGTQNDMPGLDAASSDLALAQLFLIFSIPLALGAFVERQVRPRRPLRGR